MGTKPLAQLVPTELLSEESVGPELRLTGGGKKNPLA